MQDVISFIHLLKSIWEGNLYLGALETMLRILKSGMILKFPVTTWPTDGLINCESLLPHESGVKTSMSRSDASLIEFEYYISNWFVILLTNTSGIRILERNRYR